MIKLRRNKEGKKVLRFHSFEHKMMIPCVPYAFFLLMSIKSTVVGEKGGVVNYVYLPNEVITSYVSVSITNPVFCFILSINGPTSHVSVSYEPCTTRYSKSDVDCWKPEIDMGGAHKRDNHIMTWAELHMGKEVVVPSNL